MKDYAKYFARFHPNIRQLRFDFKLEEAVRSDPSEKLSLTRGITNGIGVIGITSIG